MAAIMLSAAVHNVAPRRKKPKTSLTNADELILRALLRYHYLTALQLRRLFYSPGSLTHVNERLHRLVAAGAIAKTAMYTNVGGKPPAFYTLARAGLNYLAEQGQPVPSRFRLCEVQETYLHQRHTEALNDVLISLELLCRHQPHLELAELRHERILKREPFRLELPPRAGSSEPERVSVIADGWVDLRLDQREQGRACLWVEVDCGTEEQKDWRRKVRGLVELSQGGYQARFGTTSLTYVVIAAPRQQTAQKRAGDLRTWTQRELTSLGQEDLADLFRFAAWAGAEAGEALFLQPRWYRPFDPTPLVLLPREAGR